MATNRIQPNSRGLSVTLDHPASVSSGQPCRHGIQTGVALIDEQTDGTTVVDFIDGVVYDLSTKGIDDDGNAAITDGDALYYVDADISAGAGFLSAKKSGYFFGIALESVGSGSTDTIRVRVTSSGPIGQAQFSGLIGTDELAADAVTGPKLADEAVDSEHYTDGSVDLIHLSANSVDGTKIADDGVNSEHYTDDSIDEEHIAVPNLKHVDSQSLAYGAFTDGGGATGYLDFDTAIEADALILGWKAEVTTGFANDTTAVIEVGISGDTDRFSANTAQSCFATGTVASAALAADTGTSFGATTTVRVTVTGTADFTSINAGIMIVTMYYIETA